MSKNAHLARHRAAPDSGLKTISKAVSSNAGSIGRPAVVVAAASGLMLGMSAPASAAEQHKVESGDTLSEIAAQHDVNLNSVFELNGLSANSIIYPGDTIKVSGSAKAETASSSADSSAGTYTVKSGDTLGKIAAANNVSLQTVFGLNDMGWNTVIYPGDTIKLSGGANYSAAGSVEASEAATPAPAPAPEPEPAPAPAPAPDSGSDVTTASTASQTVGGSASTAGIAGTAQSQVGSPYVYGGTSASAGWDCSGFVQWVYAQHGIDLPRTFQWHAMTPTSNPQPGDLVVQNGGTHVGIYIGGGKMVSALNSTQDTLVHDVSAMSTMGFYTM
ncbi:C40 family peptidase [Arthrobacter castelli]|uniref:C40 family peptidase n=1 Tax=Arthrobacter castelli TaxID=271431 RepID=UPI00041D4E7E|nr:C40 family peptidase [Arthrobacter castelli]